MTRLFHLLQGSGPPTTLSDSAPIEYPDFVPLILLAGGGLLLLSFGAYLLSASRRRPPRPDPARGEVRTASKPRLAAKPKPAKKASAKPDSGQRRSARAKRDATIRGPVSFDAHEGDPWNLDGVPDPGP